MTVAHIELVADRKDERLDQFTTRSCPELSRSFVQRLIRSGHATVNSVRVTKASQRLQPGDRVFLEVPPSTPLALEPEPIPLDILYEDEHILVLNKPAGLVTHPAPGHWEHTLVHGILAYCKDLPGIGGNLRPGIVHRLDKDTSGVLAVAKSDLGHRSLSRQIKDRRVVKKYLALVQGRVTPPEGEINAPIGRHPGNRKLMTIVLDGRHAVTRYRVVQYLAGYTLVEAQPVTGRTHQIRVHFASRGHPIVGDTVYGKASPLLARQFLHAHRLGFQMPDSGLYKEFEALLPEDLQQTLDSLSTS